MAFSFCTLPCNLYCGGASPICTKGPPPSSGTQIDPDLKGRGPEGESSQANTKSNNIRGRETLASQKLAELGRNHLAGEGKPPRNRARFRIYVFRTPRTTACGWHLSAILGSLAGGNFCALPLEEDVSPSPFCRLSSSPLVDKWFRTSTHQG